MDQVPSPAPPGIVPVGCHRFPSESRDVQEAAVRFRCVEGSVIAIPAHVIQQEEEAGGHLVRRRGRGRGRCGQRLGGLSGQALHVAGGLRREAVLGADSTSFVQVPLGILLQGQKGAPVAPAPQAAGMAAGSGSGRTEWVTKFRESTKTLGKVVMEVFEARDPHWVVRAGKGSAAPATAKWLPAPRVRPSSSCARHSSMAIARRPSVSRGLTAAAL